MNQLDYTPSNTLNRLLDYGLITVGSVIIGAVISIPFSKFLTWAMNSHDPAPQPYWLLTDHPAA